MIDTPGPSAVLLRTLQIIRERGWTASWSIDDDSPLNIRSAIAKACTALVGMGTRKEWYECYLDAVHAIQTHLKSGLTDWEFTVKTTFQVEAMLAETIQRLENNAIKPRASRSRLRPSGL